MNKLSFLQHPLVRNKYAIAVFFFLLWMLFFNQIDVSYVSDLLIERKELQEQTEWYEAQNEKAMESYRQLTQDKETLEKYAREAFFMKKKSEDVFILREHKLEQ